MNSPGFGDSFLGSWWVSFSGQVIQKPYPWIHSDSGKAFLGPSGFLFGSIDLKTLSMNPPGLGDSLFGRFLVCFRWRVIQKPYPWIPLGDSKTLSRNPFAFGESLFGSFWVSGGVDRFKNLIPESNRIRGRPFWSLLDFFWSSGDSKTLSRNPPGFGDSLFVPFWVSIRK